mmetsp:Transcript_97486/g.218163  ORF Transcript_97486/g.218163 Transcript_97486/m.218163 type:complete len:218 (+) Transcript_97486:57-710(+)
MVREERPRRDVRMQRQRGKLVPACALPFTSQHCTTVRRWRSCLSSGGQTSPLAFGASGVRSRHCTSAPPPTPQRPPASSPQRLRLPRRRRRSGRRRHSASARRRRLRARRRSLAWTVRRKAIVTALPAGRRPLMEGRLRVLCIGRAFWTHCMRRRDPMAGHPFTRQLRAMLLMSWLRFLGRRRMQSRATTRVTHRCIALCSTQPLGLSPHCSVQGVT